MTILGDILSTLFERRATAHAYSAKEDGPVPDLCHKLLTKQGEVTGVSMSGKILAAFDDMDDKAKVAFFRFLLTDLDIDIEAVETALADYKIDRSSKNLTQYLNKSETKRRELLRRLNQGAGATSRLVKMRTDLLRLAKSNPDLKGVDLDFQKLFRSWFNNGFLVLRPISWASPAEILEKIIAYEAVHAINSWDELRLRLEPADRRCFAYFHPAMPDEPLIFVEVALTTEVSNSIQSVLTETRDIMQPDQAKTAVFYSISNCQQGLAGISFGNALIKNVVAELAHELPNLSTFVTLSPIPRLAAWAKDEKLATDKKSDDEMRAMAANYLLNAKRPNGMPYDPVAGFHLNNGAFVHAIHAGADTSPHGSKQSFGTMVNYMYDLSAISQNHEQFATKSKVVASKAVTALAKKA